MGFLNLLRYVLLIKWANRRSSAKIKLVQQKKLVKLVKFAIKKSEFYQKFYQGINMSGLNIEQLPVLTKQVMMANWDQIVTDAHLKRTLVEDFFLNSENIRTPFTKKLVVMHTSGTTGEKAIVAYQKASLDIIRAFSICRGTHFPMNPIRLIKQFKKGPMRFAAVLMIDGHYPALMSIFHSFARSPFIKLKLFSILLPMKQLEEELNAFQPEVMATYSSFLEDLASEQLKGNLKLNFNHPYSLLTAFSEPLTQKTRASVKNTFNCEVENTYGASECLEIARDCNEHHLHIHADYLILEIVDEMNHPVPPGQIGSKVLLTNLFNYTLPLIRYEISDMISISKEQCPCGSHYPFINEIAGRNDDVFYLRNLKGAFEAVNPMLFTGFLINLENVKEGQIWQLAYDKILLKLVPNDSIQLDIPSIVKKQKDILRNLNLDTNIDVDVEILSSIPRDGISGKLKTMIRKVPRPETVKG